MPLTFFYPEYEGKKTPPQAYVKEAVRRQQELIELCRKYTAQAQMRQRKNYDEKILRTEPYAVGQNVWVFQNIIPPEAIEEMERAVHDNRSAPAGSVLTLKYRVCGALRKPETSHPIAGRLVRTTEHGGTRVSTGRTSM